MLSAINGVYDLLGLAVPVTITGKILYSEVSSRKLRWDQVVPDEIQREQFAEGNGEMSVSKCSARCCVM